MAEVVNRSKPTPSSKPWSFGYTAAFIPLQEVPMPFGRRVLRLLVPLVLFGLLLAFTTRELTAQRGTYRAASPEYGLNIFLFDRPETTGRDLGKVQTLGFGWIKLLFPWANIEKNSKGGYNWAEADRVVAAANAAGLKVIARLDRQPGWARADGAHNGPPDNYQDYADFVRAFVARYAESSPIGRVHAIQVWNEPNLTREWGAALPIDGKAAGDYVRLLGLAYKAAKAADPNVVVIAGSLSPTGWVGPEAMHDDRYLQAMFDAGLKGKYDVLGANANVQCPCVEHDPTAPPPPGFSPATNTPSFYFRRVEQLRQIMVANGDSEKQIWLMEFGWTTDRVNPSYSWYATDEATKSELIVKAFQFAAQNWSPWIGVMTLWTIADPWWAPSDEQVWWSITNPDGSTRPPYERLLQAVRANDLPLSSPPSTAPAATGGEPSAENPSTPVSPPATVPPSSAGERLRVIGTDGAGVTLRGAPSTAAERIGTVAEGAVVEAIGDAQQNEGRTWRNVRDPQAREGWVAADFLAPA
jgi:hypothetical protein